MTFGPLIFQMFTFGPLVFHIIGSPIFGPLVTAFYKREFCTPKRFCMNDNKRFKPSLVIQTLLKVQTDFTFRRLKCYIIFLLLFSVVVGHFSSKYKLLQ